jgi:hypothetical protein
VSRRFALVAAQVGLARVDERAAALAREPVGEQRQVAPVGGERVGGEPLLDPERVGEAVDRGRAGGTDRGCARHGDVAAAPRYSSFSFCAATTFL